MAKSFLEEAQELFGEQRCFTPEEREIYDRVTKEDSVSTGINVFDLLREKDDEKTYVPLSKDDIIFVNEEAEKLWDDFVNGRTK